MAGEERSQQARVEVMDGSGLKTAFASGVAWLGNNKSLVDSLNVFPVPDGDTGTNMYLTVSSALKEAQKSNSNDIGVVADAISLGALMGARGNSGVIFSQLMRGFAKRLQGMKTAGPTDIAAAFVEAANMAYKAVIKPVEGTILTVARMTARGCVQAGRQHADVVGVLEEGLRQGQITLERTPEMLPTLKEAGVVDAGGKGFLIFLEGFVGALKGEPAFEPGELPQERPAGVAAAAAASSAPAARASVAVTPEARSAREHIEFKYCTEFIVKGAHLDPDAIKAAVLGAVEGDSALIVGNSQAVRVHIHTNSPGKVLETCLVYGSLHEIDINNMEDQHEEFEAKAGSAAEAGVVGGDPAGDGSGSSGAGQGTAAEAQERPRKPLGVVAVAAGDGFGEILRSLGVDVVVTGGQTMNPSIQDIAEAAKAANADNVIVLPNNSNVLLTAGKASEVPDTSDIRIGVVPTKTVPQGVAALLALNPSLSMEENIERMTEVAGKVKTGEVTYAVRDSSFNGWVIKEGDTIGLFDGDLRAVGESRHQVVEELMAAMYSENDEVATVFYGADVTEEEANDIVARLQEAYPNLEFEVCYGGQPLYYYLISLE